MTRVLRVIGIDPGTSCTGYGVVEEKGGALRAVTFGCIYTPAGMAMPARLAIIYEQVQQLIGEYKPQAMAVEEIFFQRNVRTALSVGQARGVVLLAAALSGLPVFEYSPLAVKQAVTGFGRADKQQVQFMVKVLLHLIEPPRPDDAADALAVAVCHLHNSVVLSDLQRR